METTQGFSLTEVLIALLLVTTTLLALLTQQWHVTQLFNQAHLQMNAMLQQDNVAEHIELK